MRIPLWMAMLVAAGSLAAQDEGPARQRLERFCDGLETLHATFVQAVRNQDGQVENEGHGEVWLARPALFRWAYQGEFPELIVADGARVWLYDEALEQVTVKPQSALLDNSPLMLLTDLSALDERFAVTEAGEYQGLYLLELVSYSPDTEFERVILGLDDEAIRYMAMEDAFGLRIEIRFDRVLRNPVPEAGMFEFTPPEGVDVVGEVGAEAGQ
jgi:outer membrane lipoprotein carrier protein